MRAAANTSPSMFIDGSIEAALPAPDLDETLWSPSMFIDGSIEATGSTATRSWSSSVSVDVHRRLH